MNFVVKTTTKCGLLDLLCPHSCRGCGRRGAVLCECCKKYLLKQPLRVCPLCKRPLARAKKDDAVWRDYVCEDCALPFAAVFVCGWREGVLAKLIKDYKYKSVRAASEVLVEVLDAAMPELPQNTVVVPLPTVGKHVRERGIDHTLVLVRKLAKRRGWRCEQRLVRAADTVQVGTKAAERQEQAKRAYMAAGEADNGANYLLLDDIWTTGASLLAAAEVLREAGAKQLMAVVLAVGRDREGEEMN